MPVTEAQWDAEFERAKASLRELDLGWHENVLTAFAVDSVEIIYGPRSACGKPAPVGIANWPVNRLTGEE